MANDEVGRLLDEIGNILAADEERQLDGIFLYAEVEQNWTSLSIARDFGNYILFGRPPHELSMMLLDLWEAEDPAKRWAAMTFVVEDGKFDADFLFSEDLDPEEESGDRHERLMRERFGDKPIHYPPLPDRFSDDLT